MLTKYLLSLEERISNGGKLAKSELDWLFRVWFSDNPPKVLDDFMDFFKPLFNRGYWAAYKKYVE